jgi:hypothetical protein
MPRLHSVHLTESWKKRTIDNISESIYVILPTLRRPLDDKQSVSCNGQVIHLNKCEEIIEIEMNEATSRKVTVRLSETRSRVEMNMEPNQWEWGCRDLCQPRQVHTVDFLLLAKCHR